MQERAASAALFAGAALVEPTSILTSAVRLLHSSFHYVIQRHEEDEGVYSQNIYYISRKYPYLVSSTSKSTLIRRSKPVSNR